MSTSTPQFVEIYLAANPNQAHLLRVLLEQEGISARVVGDFLQNAAGELPLGAASAPTVLVSAEDAAPARQIIERWEAALRSNRHAEAPVSWTCPTCGEAVSESDSECAACGGQLDTSPDDSASSALTDEPDWTPPLSNWRQGVVVIVIGLALAAAVVWWIRWGEPSHAVGYYERGVRHFDAGRYDAAIDDFNSSLRLGTSSGAYSYLGRCRHAREEYELAIQELTFALQLDGSFTRISFCEETASTYWGGMRRPGPISKGPSVARRRTRGDTMHWPGCSRAVPMITFAMEHERSHWRPARASSQTGRMPTRWTRWQRHMPRQGGMTKRSGGSRTRSVSLQLRNESYLRKRWNCMNAASRIATSCRHSNPRLNSRRDESTPRLAAFHSEGTSVAGARRVQFRDTALVSAVA